MKPYKILILAAAVLLLLSLTPAAGRRLTGTQSAKGCPCGYWIKQLGMCKLCQPRQEESVMDDPLPAPSPPDRPPDTRLSVRWCSTSTQKGRMCFAFVKVSDGATANVCVNPRPDGEIYHVSYGKKSDSIVTWYWESRGQSNWVVANPTKVGYANVYEFDC